MSIMNLLFLTADLLESTRSFLLEFSRIAEVVVATSWDAAQGTDAGFLLLKI